MLNSGNLFLKKYHIESLIGQGAFGQVYRAKHIGLNAPRALKILRKDTPGVSADEYQQCIERFKLEAQLSARLNHAHVVQVHDFEQIEDNLVLVMEYCSGGNLAGCIEQARQQAQTENRPYTFPIDEAVQIALNVSQGLAAIHALDIVHRDLKPSNILLNAQGRAKVADLGLAQITGGPSMRSEFSQFRRHPGTPGYMSPEQESSANLLPPASDVYSLGITIFELLTGRNYTLLKPSTWLRALRADAPEWLEALLQNMLEETLRQRIWDAAELVQKLQTGTEEQERQPKSKETKEHARQAEEQQRQTEQALKLSRLF